jgi:hypothetical protein
VGVGTGVDRLASDSEGKSVIDLAQKLYAQMWQRLQETRRFLRRRGHRTEVERAALRVALSIKRKLRRGMGGRVAKSVEMIALSMF